MKLLVSSCLIVLCCVSAWAEQKTKIAINAPPCKEDLVNPRTKYSPAPHRRARRAATCGTQTRLTASQATESVNVHNACRGREPSSNGLHMRWSDELAAVAQAWADSCIWEHGMLYDCGSNRIGQNLFLEAGAGGASTYPALNMTRVIHSWNNERNDWNFMSATCNPGKVCGHFTQVANALTDQVGCAFAQCPRMNVGGTFWNNALNVVCNYGPPGNMLGVPMYHPGQPCSNCDSMQTGAGYKCVNNLCAKCTPGTDATCRCGTPLTCQNGGSWVNANCACTCPRGFYGARCESSCACTDVSPSDCSQWSVYCTDPDYSDFMAQNCKATCRNLCVLPSSCSA